MEKTQNDEESHLVLRTINIPKNLDDQLRKVAFHQETSKSELIRQGIVLVLEGLRETEASGEAKRPMASSATRVTAKGRSSAAARS